MGFQGIPPNRLPKFSGAPQRPGDPTLSEWLEDFKEAVRGFNLSDRERAKTLIEHLTGPAREEVLCLSERERQNFQTVIDALHLCFGAEDTPQSLGTMFHNAFQREGESLADFSRHLMRLYSRMEAAAPTQEDADALRQLKDRALRDQFSRGARETWVRRELRRIDLETEGEFDQMRREAMVLFNDPEPVSKKGRAREAFVNREEGLHISSASAVTKPSLTEEIGRIKRELQEVRDMFQEVRELKDLVTKMAERSRTPLSQIQCYNCQKYGHMQMRCPEPKTPRSVQSSQTDQEN